MSDILTGERPGEGSPGPMARLLKALAQQPRSFLIALGIVEVLVIGVLDYLTGPQMAFSIFYLLPISLVAWFIGPKQGYLFSILSAIVWLLAELAWGLNYSNAAIPYWNAGVRLVLFLLFTYLLAQVKSFQELEATRREEAKIREAVGRSEERYRSLVENMSEGYCVLDAKGRFVYCSPNVYARTGYREKDLLGRSYVRLIDPGDRRRVADHYLSRVAEGTQDTFCEFRVRTKEGVSLWIEQSTRIVRNPDQSVVEFRNVLRDVSERRAAGLRLTEQTALHNTLLRAQSDLGVGVAMTEGVKFTYVNEALCNIYGYTAEELLALPSFLDLVPATARPPLEARMRERVAHVDVPSHGETSIVRKDGTVIQIEYAMKPISFDGPTRLYSTIRDITEDKRAQEQIRLLAQSVESTSEMISITDLANRFIFVNKAFVSAYGFREAEVLGQTPEILLAGEDTRAQLDEVFRRTLILGYTGELLNRRKDGTVFPIHLSTSQIRDRSGKIVGLIGVARDISTMRLAEEALLNAESRFESLFDELAPGSPAPSVPPKRANDPSDFVMGDLTRRINTLAEKMRERIRHVLSFSSFASHELRTPLAVVRSQLEDALDMNVPPKRLRKIVVSAYDETLRLSRTVDMLLDIATMLSGRLKLNARPLDFQKLVRDFSGDAMILCKEKNVSVSISGDARATVIGDEDRIREVLFNLFDNALKHSRPHGSIRLSTSLEGMMTIFELADSGDGIAPDDLPHIFDPFFRAASKGTENYRGSGLGLTLVKAIVEAHGGSIAVRSEQGSGTTFTLTFPTNGSI